jgi:hypothetical protein
MPLDATELEQLLRRKREQYQAQAEQRRADMHAYMGAAQACDRILAELETLVRNEAAEAGGDADEVKEGE